MDGCALPASSYISKYLPGHLLAFAPSVLQTLPARLPVFFVCRSLCKDDGVNTSCESVTWTGLY